MKYGELTLGQMEAVVNKLGGMDGVRRFLSGEITLSVPQFAIWKTVKLGVGPKTADGFRKALKDVGFKIGDWGNDILGKPAFTVGETEVQLPLVNVSVAELGFKDGATRGDIYERALSLGLELCPSEVGPQLCLQYKDQPKGEWLLIGMEPITGSDGYPHVFFVVRDEDGRWLDGIDGEFDDFWRGLHRFVFVRRK